MHLTKIRILIVSLIVIAILISFKIEMQNENDNLNQNTQTTRVVKQVKLSPGQTFEFANSAKVEGSDKRKQSKLIKIGLTKQEVFSILGKPDRIVNDNLIYFIKYSPFKDYPNFKQREATSFLNIQIHDGKVIYATQYFSC